MKEFVYSAKTRPQRLCNRCGKCCTLAVCRYTQDELKEFAKDIESEATDFLDVFIPYENLEEPKKISAEYVELIVDKFKEQGKYKPDEPIFYHCKHINQDNYCTKYDERYGWCKRMPNHGWTVIPCGCGFEGWQFALREQVKHNVRLLKEYIYECEILYGDSIIPQKNITVAELKEIIMPRIIAFEKFGSLYW